MTPQEEGRKYLGRGMYIFEETLNPTPDRGLVVDVDAMDNDEITVQTPGETGVHEVTANSFAEFTHKFAVDAGLKGSYMGFSAALKAKYSTSVTRSTKTKYMRISNILTCDVVSIGTDPDVYKDWLTKAFKNALVNKTADELFFEYGTHVAMSVKMGGSAYYSCYSVETKSLSEQNFKASAEAKFKSKGGSINGNTELTNDEKQLLDNVEGDVALDVRGGGAAEAQELRNNKPAAWGRWAASVKLSPAFMGFPEIGLIPIWKFVKDPKKQQELESAYKRLAAKHLPVAIFWNASESPSERPEASVVVPDEYKLLSGGALIPEQTTKGEGLLLTASFPESDNKWRAMGKDHEKYDTATLTAYAMALYDPDDIWEVKIFSETSKIPDSKPSGLAFILDGRYVLVGGGARVNWTGDGNLLTASFPHLSGTGEWIASSKDHDVSDAATITTYAIGLRSKLPGVTLHPILAESHSSQQAYPSAEASPPSGYTMVAGGARVNWTGNGNLLTASYPLDSNTWKARSKEHVHPDPATIDVRALGIKVSVS